MEKKHKIIVIIIIILIIIINRGGVYLTCKRVMLLKNLGDGFGIDI